MQKQKTVQERQHATAHVWALKRYQCAVGQNRVKELELTALED